MWQSYFLQIQNKYSMRVSKKEPLVIRLDGKNVTKNRRNDFINDDGSSFFSNMKKTVRYFTNKYHCYAIFGSDEVSFIFLKPSVVIEDLDKEKNDRTNEIIALFSQYFFDYFNSLTNDGDKIFWHAKCFSIKEEKIKSYIKYRSKIIKNVMTTYFLIKKDDYKSNENMKVKDEKCSEYEDYDKLKKVQDGLLYFDGDNIDLGEFLNGNTVIVHESNLEDDMFSELLDTNQNLKGI